MSDTTIPPTSKDYLEDWRPEDEQFWEEKGSRIANRTLWVTTASLLTAFAVWFVVSALIARLNKVGYDFSTSQLYWLVAMPGLAAGTLRLFHMFLTPMIGTRKVVTFSTLSLLIPLIGWYIAIQSLDTPYWVFLMLAFLAGLGGGNFSSFMPSTSLFFPKRKLGTALAIQAGIGNFGVSLVQFITPVVIGFAVIGGSQDFKKNPDAAVKEIHLQNALLLWIPIVVVLTVLAWVTLRSVPIRANVREQLDIFNTHHTCAFTSLYVMTFGAFSGLAAAFPVLIEKRFGDLPGGPDPLKYAFLGALVGSIMRVLTGPLSDRIGGAKLTMVSAIGMAACAFIVPQYVAKDLDNFTPFVISMCGIFFFAGIGNASVFKQIPMLYDARRAAGVVGWTAAIAAYGPFLVSVLISWSVAQTASPATFFYGLAVFCLLNAALNWWLYARPKAPNPC